MTPWVQKHLTSSQLNSLGPFMKHMKYITGTEHVVGDDDRGGITTDALIHDGQVNLLQRWWKICWVWGPRFPQVPPASHTTLVTCKHQTSERKYVNYSYMYTVSLFLSYAKKHFPYIVVSQENVFLSYTIKVNNCTKWTVLGKVTFKSNALQYCVTP